MSQQTENKKANSYANDKPSSIKSPPLSESIWHLPRQYVKVLFRPSAQTFREEMGKAGWGIVLVQCYLLIVITVVFSFLGHIIPSSALHTTSAFSIGAYRLFTFLPSPPNQFRNSNKPGRASPATSAPIAKMRKIAKSMRATIASPTMNMGKMSTMSVALPALNPCTPIMMQP